MPQLQPAELVARLRRPIALVGFGVEGRETLRFLLRHGAGSTVGGNTVGSAAHSTAVGNDAAGILVFDRAFDSGGGPPDEAPEFSASGTVVSYHGGEDWSALLSTCGTVIRSPGVRPDHPGLAAARAGGAHITSATELFLAACPGPVVGVTGTLGKGTTVSLIEAALNASGLACRSGGNIGLNPLAFLGDLAPGEITALELSSFQLMALQGAKPDLAVVLRTSSEHLDWHRSVTEYRSAKRGLLADPDSGQQVIFCADAPGSAEVVGPRNAGALSYSRVGSVGEGVGLAGGRVQRFAGGIGTPLPQLERLTLPGPFNLENAAAAWLAAEALGASASPALRAIAAFPGLPHRLQHVGRLEGVDCYNDSYATRPEATLGALEAFHDRPLAIILGGSEKHADFTGLAEALCTHPTLVAAVLIGATAARLEDAITEAARNGGVNGPPLRHTGDLEHAVKLGLGALQGASPQPGALVLSPACASFGMFPNYKVRGERFTALVAGAGNR